MTQLDRYHIQSNTMITHDEKKALHFKAAFNDQKERK
jgi:hypothetical protein